MLSHASATCVSRRAARLARPERPAAAREGAPDDGSAPNAPNSGQRQSQSGAAGAESAPELKSKSLKPIVFEIVKIVCLQADNVSVDSIMTQYYRADFAEAEDIDVGDVPDTIKETVEELLTISPEKSTRKRGKQAYCEPTACIVDRSDGSWVVLWKLGCALRIGMRSEIWRVL